MAWMMQKTNVKHIGRSIYGVIITATLMLTLEGHEDSAWDMVATILFALLAVAVSEYYATAFAKGIEKKRRLGGHELVEIFKESFLYMFYGSILPILLFVFSGFGWISLHSAFTYADFEVAILLIGYGYVFGQLSGNSKLRSIVFGLANFAIVELIVQFKSLLHI